MDLIRDIWNWAGSAVPRLTPHESVALIMIAAGLVVLRTFRERYLLIWILGWCAYLVSHMPIAPGWGSEYAEAISHHGEFALAVCLFAGSVFLYAQAKKVLIALGFVGVAVVAYAVAQTLFWPDSPSSRIALEIAYRAIAFAAALYLVRCRWGRWEVGPWMMAAGLVCMHLDWAPFTLRLPIAARLIPDLLLCLSMPLIVFDDSRARTRRLAVVNALTTSIARASQSGPMLLTALEELKKLMRARAAWFRLQQEDERLVVVQQIGLSPDFMMSRGSIATDDRLRALIQDGKAAVIKTKTP